MHTLDKSAMGILQKQVLTALLLLLSLTSAAHGQQIIPTVGLSTTARADIEPLNSDTAQALGLYNFTFGALINFPLNQQALIEGGALYGRRGYGYSYEAWGGAQREVYTFQELEFPLYLRILANDWLSLGFGGYYSKFVGNIECLNTGNSNTYYSQESMDCAFNGGEISYKNFSMQDSDFGILMLLGFIMKLQSADLSIDFKLRIGQKNIALPSFYASEPAAYLSHLEALAGVRIPLNFSPTATKAAAE